MLDMKIKLEMKAGAPQFTSLDVFRNGVKDTKQNRN